MPSSFLQYMVDFNNDGRRDLSGSGEQKCSRSFELCLGLIKVNISTANTN